MRLNINHPHESQCVTLYNYVTLELIVFSFSHLLESFNQATLGESHDKLRRVDSNRKSRSFSKQPSTGDYYKTLGSDTAEPCGSKIMAPNEEVRLSAVFENMMWWKYICYSICLWFSSWKCGNSFNTKQFVSVPYTEALCVRCQSCDIH